MAFLAVVRIPWYGWKTIGLVTKGCCCSAAKIMSNSLQSHELQHTRLPWLSSLTIFLSLFKLMSIESLMPSNRLILCCPLLLLPSVFPSIRIFSIESALRIRWPKYWNFSFSIHPSNEYSGLLGWTGWISLQSKGLSRVFSNTTVHKHHFSALSFLYSPTLTSIHDHWKNHSLD